MPRSERTSFGEVHAHNDEASVEERALKVFNLGKAALTFSGDVEIGYDFIGIVHQVLVSGEEPLRAFEVGAQSIGSSTSAQKVSVLMTSFYDGKPKLTSFQGGQIQRNCKLVQFGAIGPGGSDYATELVSLAKLHTPNVATQLACVLANIQSFSIRDCLIDKRGIGGVFSGLSISKESVKWHPDMVYMLANDDMFAVDGETDGEAQAVLSIVRDDIHLVRSPFTGGTVAFSNSPDRKVDHQSLIKRSNAIARELYQIESEKRFDFVALIHTVRPIVAIIEMQKNQCTRHLGFVQGRVGGSESVIKYFRRCQENNPNKIYTHFFPF